MFGSAYLTYRPDQSMIRLPRNGWIDLTYRCNNNCRHCWTRLPASAAIQSKELSFEKIRNIADQARQSGCTHWSISGGEPMLRPDFFEIFDYLTRHAISFDLNTNGTLINPAITKLLTRRGYIMVALYGSDAHIHDHITRIPGSFEACMRGIAYLKEASVDFTVQLIPMQDNYYKFNDMIQLARRLSPSYRIGASWLYLSADRDPRKNQEIIRQRLAPAEGVALDPARPTLEDYIGKPGGNSQITGNQKKRNHFLKDCISQGQQFHIDPYGNMSLCSFMKDPSLRFNLNTYSFDKIWDEMLPAAGLNCTGMDEYAENCGSCNYRDTCHWCPAYSHLENGRLSAPVPYLCEMAKERLRYKETWRKNNYQVYELAGMTLHVDSDIPLNNDTFGKRFNTFRKHTSLGDDHLYISHHFSLPNLKILKDAQLVYDKLPWAIYRYGSSWIYLGLGPNKNHYKTNSVAVFNQNHNRVRIFHKDDSLIRKGNLGALTAFPTDQIMMARVLADREGCYLHSSGMILNDQGILFIGRSGAGKSTIVKMLKDYGTVLSDDRNIVRHWQDGHYLHGTWSHGEVPLVSNSKASLKAILFIEKARKNQIIPITDKNYIMHQLLNRVIKPFCTLEWWDKIIQILSDISEEIPSYRLRFTKDKLALLNSLEKLVGPLTASSSHEYPT